MADDESDFSEEWDEYEWERFLQQQDRNTERYLGLLEKYMDHPDRDQLIAREMGWGIDDDKDVEGFVSEMEEEMECFLDEEDAGFSDEDEEDSFSDSPLFRRTMRLNQRISRMMDRHPHLEDQPDMIKLAACAATCGAKLGAALCRDDFAELGMTIAYLKRGLKAANDALDACEGLVRRKALTRRQLAGARADLFALRDATVSLMGEYRAEWRRRFGRA